MKRSFVLFLALFVVLSLGITAVSADTVGFSGTIDPANSSQMNHSMIGGNTCSGDIGLKVFYHARTLSVDTSGTYTFTLSGSQAGIYLYANTFDPTAPTTNCVGAVTTYPDSGPVTLEVPLTAGTAYTLIVWDDGTPSETNYSGSIEGEGIITLGEIQPPNPPVTPEPTPEVTPDPTQEVTPDPTQEVTPDPTPEVTPDPTQEVTPDPTQEVTPDPTQEVTPDPTPEVTPDPTEEVTDEPTEEPVIAPTGTPVPLAAPPQPCLYPFPTGASLYFVPQGAPTFYQPKLETQNAFNLPAGTWYITELDDDDDFAKVWIACRAAPVYIPLNAIDLPAAPDAD